MDTVFSNPRQDAAWAVETPPSNEAADSPRRKKRSSAACFSCRARKVRCDVEGGHPCTNCRFDGSMCAVPVKRSRRTRQPRGSDDRSAAKTSLHLGAARPRDRRGRIGAARQSSRQEVVEAQDPETSSEHSQPTQQTVVQQSPPDAVCGSRDDPEPQIPPWGIEEHISLLASAPFAAAARHLEQWRALNTIPLSPTQSPLPNYIRDHPPTICSRGADYLARMGCFSLPYARLRNELVASYLRFMHHRLPLFDLPRLCSAMGRRDRSFQISLLVFQAIMFAGAAFVDMYHLQSEGYRSRSDARKTFYHRVRLLYDYRYEPDVVATMHALLIVTHSAGETAIEPPTPQGSDPIPGARPMVNTSVAFPFQPQAHPDYMHHMMMMAGMSREGTMPLPGGTPGEMQFAPAGGTYSGLCMPDNFPILP
ncbi:hypothetical protein BJY00DRAFT_310645 [Aspergillus carlsbadensis]|nr:hypothetical protein BJY00DRAFT_310645 [Aspergillus carlsbadensis]